MLSYYTRSFGLFIFIAVLFVGEEVLAWPWDKPVVVDPCQECGLRHEYHKMECEEQFKTVSREVTANIEALREIVASLNISAIKINEISQRNIEIVIWLRDLCGDWNAGAICAREYQKRKEKRFDTFERLHGLTIEGAALERAKEALETEETEKTTTAKKKELSEKETERKDETAKAKREDKGKGVTAEAKREDKGKGVTAEAKREDAAVYDLTSLPQKGVSRAEQQDMGKKVEFIREVESFSKRVDTYAQDLAALTQY